MRAWMMSSETSTDGAVSSLRPWHFFTLVGLLGATVAVLAVRPSEPAAVALLVAAVWAGSYVCFGVYRMLLPLLTRQFSDQIETVGGKARAALEREKTLVLRSIKELEFDRAMGKVSDDDFEDMGAHLRRRARALLKQLDVDGSSYREIIERELTERLDRAGLEPVASEQTRRVCSDCDTRNELDATFCKSCGAEL